MASSAYLHGFGLPTVTCFPTYLTQQSPPNPLWNTIQVGHFLSASGLPPPHWRTQRYLPSSANQSCYDSGSVPSAAFRSHQSYLLGQSAWCSAGNKTKAHSRCDWITYSTGDMWRTVTAQLTPNLAAPTGEWNLYFISTQGPTNTLQSSTAHRSSTQ